MAPTNFILSLLEIAAATFGNALWQHPAQGICSAFHEKWGNQTYLPDSPAYNAINQDYFTGLAKLGPACIVSPASVEELSTVLNTLVAVGSPFALRGAGHMPVSDAANINSTGVLVTSEQFTQLELSADKSTIKVGAGNRWGDVFRYLASYGLTVVGGRIGLVGVPGFLLGGGISFLSNECGWASANVEQYDCVLASGQTISARYDNEHADLYWALCLGGNSFAIVTAFHLRTIPLPAVSLGYVNYASSVTGEQWLDAVHDYALDGISDVKSSIEAGSFWNPQTQRVDYNAMLFHNSNNSHPASLSNFTTRLASNSSSFQTRPGLTSFLQEADQIGNVTFGLRNRFYLHTIRANREAMQIIHDIFYDLVATELSGAVQTFVASLRCMPISASHAEASRRNGGDAAGLDPAGAPYVWMQEVHAWPDPADDERMDAFFDRVHARIEENLGRLDDVRHPFVHINHADHTQPVFEGYGNASLARMKEVRDKYDPGLVFTNLMPGGWKFSKAYSGEYDA